MFDVIVVGGSYGGLAAALQLGRARRRVLVIDEGQRRNRFAESSHGLLGNDGGSAGEIVARGRAEVMAYPSVEWKQGRAERAGKTDTGFLVGTADGETYEARRLILAGGVVDDLPQVPGLSERWGKSVFHCPYCDGYELDGGRIGVLASSPATMHHALLLPEWGKTTFFLNGVFAPSEEEQAQLLRRDVAIETGLIEKISGAADVVLRDGRVFSLAGLFTATITHLSNTLAEQLGCELDQGSVGTFIKTDSIKETSVPGVFACGDAGRPAGSVALAVGDGTLAGIGAHRSLVFGED
ncbi:NAD(P)/FAD-dependent oxidoreductase [Chelativorans sp. AA-79]|uniref:NAD(P)/FAD-dependent oxidoreductase n=1 Tax=Chelativorans sp. AA-79 TaxID=3028735 RepID=UPI0023F7E557|nr:NAD(P)/FAD-dependent oxidoreductase [Chelativorans sp. AA-79]WEX07957.1 NAD(P)/FAD-dependent oxidoreductase [Chelativorans sp. AA-79]